MGKEMNIFKKKGDRKERQLEFPKMEKPKREALKLPKIEKKPKETKLPKTDKEPKAIKLPTFEKVKAIKLPNIEKIKEIKLPKFEKKPKEATLPATEKQPGKRKLPKISSNKESRIMKMLTNSKNGKQDIRSKMMRSYTIIVALCAVASISALIMLAILGGKLSSFYEDNYVTTVNTWDIRDVQSMARTEMLNAMLENDTKVILELMETSRAYLDDMGTKLADLRADYKGDVSVFDQIEYLRQKAQEAGDTVVKNIGYGAKSKAREIMTNEYIPAVDVMAEALEYVAGIQEADAKSKVSQSSTITVVAILITVAITAVAVMVAFLIGNGIANGISKPVKEIEQASQQLAAGNLNVEISYQGADELGSLAESMRSACEFMQNVIADTDHVMKELADGNFAVHSDNEEVYAGDFRGILTSMQQLGIQLSATIGEIHEYSNRVALGAQHLAEGAQHLAEGAMEQTNAVTDLKSMLDDITTSSKKAVDTTEQSYNKAMQFQTLADTGRSEMEELLKAMDAISSTSGQIEKIIAEIEDIADQTNLLSLNASIEAARAGESGRGFAVVADQIGKLATASAQSAVRTRQLIQNTMKEIKSGNEITKRTSETLVQVVDGINLLAEQVKNVNEGVAEQAGFVTNMEGGVQRIAEVIELNAASAEESTATSEELSAQADNLEALVDKFQI